MSPSQQARAWKAMDIPSSRVLGSMAMLGADEC